MSSSKAATSQPCWLLLGGTGDIDSTRTSKEQVELQKELESNASDRKINAMKRLVRLISNGVSMPTILMTVIRYVSEKTKKNKHLDHQSQKLTHISYIYIFRL
jgi:hypothetical protein